MKLFDSMWIPLQLVHISCFKQLILTFSRGHPQSAYAQIFLFLTPFFCTLFNKRNVIAKQWLNAFQLIPSLPLSACVLYEWPPRDFLNATIMLNWCNINNYKLSSFSAGSNKVSWLFDRFLCLHCVRLCFAHEGMLESIIKE